MIAGRDRAKPTETGVMEQLVSTLEGASSMHYFDVINA